MDRKAQSFIRTLARSVMIVAAFAGVALGQSRPSAESRPAAAAPAPETQPVVDPSVWYPLVKRCPEALESLMLVSAAGLPEKLADLLTVRGDFQKDATFKAVRAVYAGRKFNERFDYEGLNLFELENPMSLPDVLREDKFHYETIAGVPCFVRKPSDDDNEWGPREIWLAVVDRRILISATRRSVLKEALTGKGAGAEVRVEKLGWKPAEVSWGSPLLIVKKSEPDKKRATPIERLLLTFEPAKKKARVEVQSKDGAATLQHLRRLLSDRRAESRPAEEDESFPGFGTIDLVSSKGDQHVFTMGVPQSEFDWLWERSIDMLYRGIHFY
jgi:hypothetical protein